MKTIILAGGLGTRLAEETDVRPKPMVEIGGMPIIWHILKIYSHYGINEFCIALGYKGEYIKKWFLDYVGLGGDMTIRTGPCDVQRRNHIREDWTLHLVETGLQSSTGGRIRRLQNEIGKETFCVTYGDGVGNVNVADLIRYHRSMGKYATVTAVRPPARYGGLIFEGNMVKSFTEKPQAGEGWVNGGFFVFEPEVFNYIDRDETVLETQVLERLVAEGQLAAYRHPDFWQCMDTIRDKHLLESLWSKGSPPWKVWE